MRRVWSHSLWQGTLHCILHTASCGGAFNLIYYRVFAEDAGQVCTMKTENRLFSNLEKGRISIGSVVSMSDLIVSELAGDCGMDFAWIDAEHAPHTIQDVQRHLIALRGTGCAGLSALEGARHRLVRRNQRLGRDGRRSARVQG